METKGAPESMATVNMKPEYASSEYSEAPPAYHKLQSSAVQVAKIIAVTVVLVSFVLGSFMLAASYVQANASCRLLENDLELLADVADRFDTVPHESPQAEALIGEDSDKQQLKRQVGKDTKDIKIREDNSINDKSDEKKSEKEDVPIHAHFPLTLDFDELAGNLVAKNQKSKMNCVVEKKRAEEMIDHKPKNIRLPFGVNLTTDPRLEKITGERMVIICESGNIVSHEQPKEAERSQNNDNDEDNEDESEEDAIMIQPVMIPIPQAMFQTHMPQQVPPAQQPQPFPQPMRPFNPMEHMRPPMPPMQMQGQFRPPMQPFRPPMEAVRPPMESYRPSPVREFVDSYRPIQPQEQMRPPMPPMEQHRVAPQFIAIRQIEMRPVGVAPQMEPETLSLESDEQQREPQRPHGLMTVAFRPPMDQPEHREEPEAERPSFIPQQVSIRVQSQESNGEMPPNPIIQHIIQSIISQKIMEAKRAQEASRLQPVQEESREDDYQPQNAPQQEPQGEAPQGLVHPGLPIPEILTELNRLPNPENRVIVAVATANEESGEDDSSATNSASDSASHDDQSATSQQSDSQQDSSAQQQDSSAQQDSQQDSQQEQETVPITHIFQKPKESASEMNGRQVYARMMPINIPVNMHDQEQEPQAVASEETRPHYVQPRSVSV